MKTYRGTRTPTGCTITVIDGDREYELDPRHDIRNHSPDGFSWGYNGSGPAQASLALLADALGDSERAQNLYQSFKFKVIGRIDGDSFELTEQQIQETAAQLEAERGRRL